MNCYTRCFGDKQRRCTDSWLTDYTWLKYSVSTDSVICAPCLLFDNRKARKFSSRPYHDWKNLRQGIDRHLKDDFHKDSVAMAENFVDVMEGTKESIVCKLSSSNKERIGRNRHILGEIIRVLLLLSKQNIAVRGHTMERSNFMAVLEMHAQTDPVLDDHLKHGKGSAKYTSPEIQNELIGLCADHVRQKVISQCQNADYFAIMADEATDCSTKEQLSICIRYLAQIEGKYELHEEFIGFVTCKSIKGLHLSQTILQFLQDSKLDILKLRGQCYDGAGNMAGKYNGVQALIRERVPLATYTHCKSHCLNLALVHSCKLQCVRTMMKTVQDVGFGFSYSAKRLEAFSSELSEDPITRAQLEGRQKLKTLCETRWMSRADALSTFQKAFNVVVHALESLEADGDVRAGEHVRAILRFDFIIALVTCDHVLSILVGLTAILQGVGMDLIEAVREAGVVTRILRAERQDEAVFDAIFEKAVTIAAEFEINPSVPRQNPHQRNRANYAIGDPLTYWRIALFNVFVDHLVEEIDQRLLSNQERFCAQLLLPTRFDDLDDGQADNIYTSFSDDIDSSREAFSGEVRRWKVRWNADNVQKPATLLATLNATPRAAYPAIHRVLSVLITMPATSASCERSFSSMRRIKSYLRSTMSGERLSDLGILHIHRESDVAIDAIINKFASVKCRNMDFMN